jgi:translin
MPELADLVLHARATLEQKNQAREVALTHGRTLIRTCANAIRAMHRGEREAARAAVENARIEAARVADSLTGHPDILFAGYVQDAHKELAEAACLLALIEGTSLPSPDALGVVVPAFLNGLAEAASEGRRYALDRLRRDDVAEAERMLGVMDDILSELVTVDFPDAVTDGLRRTCDALRAVVERTRGDITSAVLQTRLRDALAAQQPSTPER